MKEIKLTQGQVALVDDCDFERLNQFKWSAEKGRNTFYAIRRVQVNKKQSAIRMHCVVLGRSPKGLMPDHRNGRGTDNRRKNLRFVTNRQNLQNRRNKNKSSKYLGVCWDKYNKKWKACIQINGVNKHLGCFADEKEAFETYKRAVNDLGEKLLGE